MNENTTKSASSVNDDVKLFVEAAVSAAVDSLASGCRSGQIKVEYGESRVIWLNLFINDTTGPTRRFVAETNDIDDLVGIAPSFRFGSDSCENLKAAINQYLCSELVGAQSVSASVFRYTSGSGELPILEGSSALGAVLREQPAVRWEPIGPCGFGC